MFTKQITIKEDVYNLLKLFKLNNETFSSEIQRLIRFYLEIKDIKDTLKKLAERLEKLEKLNRGELYG